MRRRGLLLGLVLGLLLPRLVVAGPCVHTPGSCAGGIGPAGPTGPAGSTGPAGAEGPPGPAGPGAEVHVLVGPHTCAAGSNDGTRCFTNGICAGGGTCTKTGTCTTALADSFDAGGAVGSPHTFSHTFAIPGTYPYVCGIHPGAPGVGMAGTVVVAPLVTG